MGAMTAPAILDQQIHARLEALGYPTAYAFSIAAGRPGSWLGDYLQRIRRQKGVPRTLDALGDLLGVPSWALLKADESMTLERFPAPSWWRAPQNESGCATVET